MTDQRKRIVIVIVIVIVGANFAGLNAAIKLSRHPSSGGRCSPVGAMTALGTTTAPATSELEVPTQTEHPASHTGLR